MKKHQVIVALSALALIVAIGACKGKKEGPAERAGESIDNAVENAGKKMDEAVDAAKKKMDEMADEDHSGHE